MTPTSPRAARILVVDDMPENLRLLTMLLEAWNYDVRPAPSGELALQAAQREPPELVLLDVNMPGLNGFEVYQRLRADPRTAAVPVIFISGRGDTADKVRALELGAVDYVTKPFDPDEVEARVRTHVELARLRRQLQQHNAQLEEKVAERTRELAGAKARLASLDQAKSEFLQLISHELRTPLTGIFGVAELLLELCGDSAEADRYAALFQRSRRRIMGLVEDALLLCEIGSGADLGAQQHCPLLKLLNDACAEASPFARSRGVDMTPVPAELGIVLGVPKYLVRALHSVLETAIKFARPGSVVRLASAAEAEAVSLSVEADGQCIPAETLPRFFDLLSTAQPLASGGDLGLAPAVAQRILGLYGGAVSVENINPPGVRFVVRLKGLGLATE